MKLEILHKSRISNFILYFFTLRDSTNCDIEICAVQNCGAVQYDLRN